MNHIFLYKWFGKRKSTLQFRVYSKRSYFKMFGSLERLTMCIRCSCSNDRIIDEESTEIFSKHRKLIKNSWKVISSEFSKPRTNFCNFSDIGTTDAFIEMFERYPETKSFFVQFSGIGMEEIQSNPELFNILKNHSEKVFMVIEAVIHDLSSSVEKV